MSIFTLSIISTFVSAIVYIIKNNGNPNKKNVVLKTYDFSKKSEMLNVDFESSTQTDSVSEKKTAEKKILDEIEDLLIADNINSEINNNTISWVDNFGTTNEVHLSMTAIAENKIAWWQCNGVGNDSVKIKLENGVIINWKPPLNTMGLSSLGCGFIKFLSQFLIVMYNDKHTNRIFAINSNNSNVKEIDFYGYIKRIKFVDNELFISNFSTDEVVKVTIFQDDLKSKKVGLEYLKERNINLE